YSDLFTASLRLLTAVPLGLSLVTITSNTLGPLVAFCLGAFPIRALSLLTRRLALTQLKLEAPAAQDDQTIAMVGVTQQVSDMLLDENISCAQQLADMDPVLIAVRTGLSFDYVLFLVAQSMVWCFLGKTAGVLGPLGYADCRAIYKLMTFSTDAERDRVFTSLDQHFE